MDFDEYEYLEKTVENLEPEKKSRGAANCDESLKSGERDRSRSSRHRSDSQDDLDHRGSDRHIDRSSSRHRSRSRDVERSKRDRERHRSSRERKDRDKERDDRNGRDRERDRHKDRDSDRDRDHDRERKEKDGEKEKERERDRDRRSRSHSEKHRDDRGRSQDRERRERELRERDREGRCARANSRWTFWHLSHTLGLRFWVINVLHRIVKSMQNLQLCLHVAENWD